MAYNFKEIIQGDTFLGVDFEIKDTTGTAIDLTDYVIRMHVRKKASEDSEKLMTFTTLDGTIVIDAPPTDGKVSIPERTIDLPPFPYVYDIEFTAPTGRVRTWIRGAFPVVEAVTH